MPSLFKRKTEPAATEPDGADDTPPVEAGARPKAYTEKKGRPTPKRKDAQKRSAEAPPADRKEAARRLRERQRVERSEARQKMMAGDERYLPARDRGPERALVRDVVDSRRNVGSYFLIAALVILIGTSQGMPPVVRLVTQFLWYALAVIFIADCVLVCRRVRKTVKAKYPKSQVRFGGLYWYAIMRSITFRKLRMPNPKVKIGERP
ncbi:DUF3043 domain-containing protein [Actinocatenispora rupis]|uniref:DUF3043 domain-containing protein n=1 Tax=Actinocatenispora rupis TaxID=519421 RepID=A0A8J3J2N0_9ACTN|nr:DUF3043 domain-containing protein [Actinocatenispora rupis]GID13455.1 hypothetical protein Aru02nite_43440 [Actinocatenispora rupis]